MLEKMAGNIQKGKRMVQKTIEAIYSQGVLKPLSPLSLTEGETVHLIITASEKIPHLLELALQVYEGLSQEERDAVEQVACDRRNFWGHRG